MILKFVLRMLRRHAFLNMMRVLALSLALSSIVLIAFYLKYELSYDSTYEHKDRIYRLTTVNPDFLKGKHFARLSMPSYLDELKESYPEIENYVRLAPVKGGSMKYKDQFVTLNQGFECDSSFFELFNAELVQGNPDYALGAPGNMVISESYARRVFGDENPIGEVIAIPEGQYYGENTDYVVSAVMQDFPAKGHFHPEFLAVPEQESRLEWWAWTYLLLKENANPQKITDNFKEFYTQHFSIEDEIELTAFLQPLQDIHLNSNKTREIESNGTMTTIISFALAAALLLLIALVNYANLNIGMAVFGDKFLYVNKIFGSDRRFLFRYFLVENSVILVLVLAVSMLLVSFALQKISQWFSLDLWTDNSLLAIGAFSTFAFLAVVAGTLPMIRKSFASFARGLGAENASLYKRKGMSKGLIVAQNMMSVALIIAVLLMSAQARFAMKRAMDGGENTLVVFEDVHAEIQQNFVKFKEELLKYNSIEYVTGMMEPPGGEANDRFRFRMEGYEDNDDKPENNTIGIFPCDYSFASLFDLEFIAGTNFSEEYSDKDGLGEYIINESAVFRLNHTDPSEIIGKEFALIFGDGTSIPLPEGKIIGVVNDFNLSSLKREIEPMVFFKRDQLWLINLAVAIKPGLEKQAEEDISKVWEQIFPEHPMEFQYVDDLYAAVYYSENLQTKLLSGFTLIALIICSMGLIGMSLLMSQRRQKEIGIRRVNGAESMEILWSLNWDFLKLVLLGTLLAIPLSIYTMSLWLENFAYRVDLSWWIFVLAGSIALLISFIVVSLQVWKVANRNPVEALRYE